MDKIRLHEDCQCRIGTDQEHVADLAENRDKWHRDDPPTVYFDGTGYILADGYHRYQAHQKVGSTTAWFRVFHGGLDAAVQHAIGANHDHGLRRSNADKRKALSVAVRRWPGKSNRWYADACHVSAGMVDAYMSQSPTPNKPPAVEGRDGKTYKAKPDLPDFLSDEDEPATVAQDPPTTRTDKLGNRIPDSVLGKWIEAENAYRQILQSLTHARDAYEALRKSTAWMGEGVAVAIRNPLSSIRGETPHATCPYCNGEDSEHCNVCAGRGWLSKAQYDRVPEDLR